jgi:putative surface-exposed virulence protein
MKAFMLTPLIAALAICPGMLLGRTIIVDDDARDDPGPGDPAVSDPLEDGTFGHPFDAIQEGINAAVAGDTVLVLKGVYTGEGNRDLNFGGKAITVRSRHGAKMCIIDCGEVARGVTFETGETRESVLDGFTIQNGFEWEGGGILCDQASPTIRNCIVTACRAEFGAAGVRFFLSDALLSRCQIVGNTAVGAWYDCTGGISCVAGAVVIEGCYIKGNHGLYTGGGIWLFAGDTTITGCWVSDNVVSLEPGAQNLWDFSGGGGLACYFATVAISNCVFSGNSAQGPSDKLECGGGALLVAESTDMTITNCTFVGNTARDLGGALYVLGDKDPLGLSNCIVWGNSAPRGHELALVPYGRPFTLTVRYCDVQGGAAGAYVGPGCTVDYDASNIDADPLFRDAAGGDYRLRCWSPCIDAGTSDGAPERDILGARRWDVRWIPNTGGGDMPWYDIGAYEFRPGCRSACFRPHWRGWTWQWPGRGKGCGNAKGHR